MVQPIDYATLAGGFQSPQEAFTNTIKLREYYLQQQKAAEEARKTKEKTVQMEIDLKDYTTDPNPQKLASLHLRYPVLKQGLDAYTQTLSDADKRTTTDFATQAFVLNRGGKTEDVLSLFDRYIAGAEKRPDMVRVFKDAKDAYSKIDDLKAREALIGSVLAGTGKEGLELYEKIFNVDKDLSPVGKEYQDRVRIQGKDEADKWLKLQGEKLFAVPEGGELVAGSSILGKGPITGKAAPPTVTFTPLKEGGQTEKPSGNFR
jgi:hypothetical protein